MRFLNKFDFSVCLIIQTNIAETCEYESDNTIVIRELSVSWKHISPWNLYTDRIKAGG